MSTRGIVPRLIESGNEAVYDIERGHGCYGCEMTVAMELEEDEEEIRREFYGRVRECIISLLLGVCVYLVAYWGISRLQRHTAKEECYSGDEDAWVHRISTWLCSFALCVSIGSVLLLPVSIVGNEVLVCYPDSYYVKWLNTSLIRGLWNQVFLGCNVSLFALLPFSYFFMESVGLPGCRKGIMSRVYETVILLMLLAVLASGLAWLLASFLAEGYQTGFTWWSYLPFLYSLVSMLGVLLMSVCTPLGFSRLFILLGKVISRPMVHTNVEEELEQLRLEEAAISRRVRLRPGQRLAIEDGPCALSSIQERRSELEHHLSSSPWERRLLFPLSFVILLVLTITALLLVATNCLSLSLHPANIPGSVQDYLLGRESTSALGALGALLEVVIIVYFMGASVVGLYSTPILAQLLPTPHDTPMSKVIINCSVLLVLSSALPLMARTLGITQFNLLGHFGSFEWLGNFWLVFCCNFVFLSITIAVLCTQVSRTLLREVTWLLGAGWWAGGSKFQQKSPPKAAHGD